MSMSTQAEAAKTTREGLWEYVAAVRPRIEQALLQKLPLAHVGVETFFNDALRYSLFPGGKRLRPVLTMLGAEVAGGRAMNVLPAAVAVEYIHNSSLIFDDLLDLKEDAALACASSRPLTFALERGERDTSLRICALIKGAKQTLIAEFGPTRPTLLLCELADYVVNRES